MTTEILFEVAETMSLFNLTNNLNGNSNIHFSLCLIREIKQKKKKKVKQIFQPKKLQQLNS